VLATGPNGAGKTNLLESLHVGTQGFSPRTRNDAQLIRFGETASRIALRGASDGRTLELEVVLQTGEAKRAKVNGAPLRASEQLRSTVSTLVFTPDRLAVVKGGPAVRRAYFDRALGRLVPARATLPAEYGAALAQRNAALRRISLNLSSADALAPWTERIAKLGAALVEARRETIRLLSPAFAACAADLALEGCALVYDAEAPTVEALEARSARDLERGWTGAGPHLDEIGIAAGGRDLRTFGSQGEQRLAVLSLLLAEAELIADRTGAPPLLLLDDVLSELDPERRRVLATRIGGPGQALVTSTTAGALPLEPAQLLEVSPGRVVAR
jgi:DNA replication and repair protein RecF